MRAGSGVGLGNVNLTAGGDFTIVREGAEAPVLVGTISTVRGTYDFQGRRFEVQRDGQITFRGSNPSIRRSTSPPNAHLRDRGAL
jgi:autotransporter translocation and assembly factor TamB